MGQRKKEKHVCLACIKRSKSQSRLRMHGPGDQGPETTHRCWGRHQSLSEVARNANRFQGAHDGCIQLSALNSSGPRSLSETCSPVKLGGTPVRTGSSHAQVGTWGASTGEWRKQWWLNNQWMVTSGSTTGFPQEVVPDVKALPPSILTHNSKRILNADMALFQCSNLNFLFTLLKLFGNNSLKN